MVNCRMISTFAACCLSAYMPGKSHAQDERPRNPIVRVVTVCQDGLQGQADAAITAATLTRLDRAASFRPDIACLPEAFTRAEP